MFVVVGGEIITLLPYSNPLFCCNTMHWFQNTAAAKKLCLPLRLSPHQPSSNWSYKTYKFISPKGRVSQNVKLAILRSQSSTFW